MKFVLRKKLYLKNVKCQDNLILNVEALREYCIRNSSPPDDENVSFVPYYYIEGDTEDTLVMTVIWSTKQLIRKISNNLIQDDGTYKLNWYQYPLFVSGRSSSTGRFF